MTASPFDVDAWFIAAINHPAFYDRAVYTLALADPLKPAALTSVARQGQGHPISPALKAPAVQNKSHLTAALVGRKTGSRPGEQKPRVP